MDAKHPIVAIAAAQLGVHETSANQGPGLEKCWTATSYGPDGYKNREPWCADRGSAQGRGRRAARRFAQL